MVQPKPNQPKRIITWEQYWKNVQALKDWLLTRPFFCMGSDQYSDSRVLFIGIPRGGVILNTLLTYSLGAVRMINPSIVDLPIVLEANRYVITTYILVDDIADSGKTLLRYLQCFTERQHKANDSVVTLVMYKRYNCPVHPDIFCQEIKDNFWLNFPYEEKE